MDFSTDTVIAKAQENWLVSWTKVSSFVTEDGHNMHAVPFVGAEIIPVND